MVQQMLLLRQSGSSLVFKRHSHIGRALIQIPENVKLSLSASDKEYLHHPFLRDAQQLLVEGPKGSLKLDLPRFLQFSPEITSQPLEALAVSVQSPLVKQQRSIWGLFRSLINNAVQGVHAGHSTSIQLIGVGYRAALEKHPITQKDQLNLKLGYPQPVIESVPEGVIAKVNGTTNIILEGADKEALGQFAARIRRWRKPEPYNGKGIFVNGEAIRRKEIKKK